MTFFCLIFSGTFGISFFFFWPLILPLCNFLIPCKFATNITTGNRTSPFSQFSCFSLGIYCLVSWLKAVQGSVRLMVRAVVPARGRIHSFVALSLMASSFPLWCQALDPRLPSVLLWSWTLAVAPPLISYQLSLSMRSHLHCSVSLVLVHSVITSLFSF